MGSQRLLVPPCLTPQLSDSIDGETESPRDTYSVLRVIDTDARIADTAITRLGNYFRKMEAVDRRR